MNICVIGAGYVGLTSAAVLAHLGHQVMCIDKNKDRINELNNGIIPIYEPGLTDLINKNKERLTFSDDINEGISNSTILLIAVGTPSNSDGSSDLSYIDYVINDISKFITSYKTIITKSTVPPGTNMILHQKLLQKGVNSSLFDIVSNPEFLREGSAISDMIYADRIIVGVRHEDSRSFEIIKKMYHGLHSPFITTNLNGAEMIKYASNSFLALKISFINEVARICDQYQVDIQDVAKGIGIDARIGPHFLQAGIGYGGSCFPKDVRALEFCATSKKIKPTLLVALQEVNDTQVHIYIRKLQEAVPNLDGVTIAILGIAFKANTDDVRHSPAVRLIEQLSSLGCNVQAYDPKAKLPNMIKNVTQMDTIDETLMEAECVVVVTDWDIFKQLNWEDVKSLIKGNLIIDARNCLNKNEVEKCGLKVIGVGIP
jgi:UDPglucose 6-dehydrogenase